MRAFVSVSSPSAARDGGHRPNRRKLPAVPICAPIVVPLITQAVELSILSRNGIHLDSSPGMLVAIVFEPSD